jgi:hypothetical protein
MITGEESIELYRMMVLQKMLHLEICGLKRRGRSAYSIIKQDFGLKGNRQRVHEQLSDLIEERKNAELSDN